jgi:hypothetical protein
MCEASATCFTTSVMTEEEWDYSVTSDTVAWADRRTIGGAPNVVTMEQGVIVRHFRELTKASKPITGKARGAGVRNPE